MYHRTKQEYIYEFDMPDGITFITKDESVMRWIEQLLEDQRKKDIYEQALRKIREQTRGKN